MNGSVFFVDVCFARVSNSGNYISRARYIHEISRLTDLGQERCCQLLPDFSHWQLSNISVTVIIIGIYLDPFHCRF